MFDDDYICLWPCGTWCYPNELEEYQCMSDDYERVYIEDPRYVELTT